MCGIVGYIGDKDAVKILLEGLAKLEYRGYDSAGIAVIEDGKIVVEKAKGKLENLRGKLANTKINATMGIGHTRWATHGKPSDENSHPHTSQNGKFSLVHNGIIENYLQLKEEYLQDVTFTSQTDSEVAVQLIEHFYNGDLNEAIRKTMSVIRGAYTLVIIAQDYPNQVIACRKDSPLVLGVGNGENFIASDVPALLEYTKNCIYVEDNDLCILTKEGITILDSNNQVIKRKVQEIQWSTDAALKGGYEHFMLKEIFEQPEAFKRTMMGRIVDNQVILKDSTLSVDEIKNFRKIHIVACGTAYHSGLVGRNIFEKLTKIPVEVEVASEFRYREPMLDKDTLVIVISQSGETADTIAAMREAKKIGCKTLAITNVVGSAIAREADDVFYLWAGPEISVASTKAYTTMLLAQYIIAVYFANIKQTISSDISKELIKNLEQLPDYTQSLLADEFIAKVKTLAETYKEVEDCFFIGRGMDWSIAMEGSLKLKEISYIHAEAYAAGELKHGTLALITDKTPVIALNLQSNTYEKTLSNIKEVTARDAKVLAIVKNGDNETKKVVEDILEIPAIDDFFMPILATVPLQLMAYFVAKVKGCAIDQPRNLAKSVTVE